MSDDAQAGLRLLRGEGGALCLLAQDVTGLLRALGTQWQESCDAGMTDLGEETVHTFARTLAGVADQLDAECIARAVPAAGQERH